MAETCCGQAKEGLSQRGPWIPDLVPGTRQAFAHPEESIYTYIVGSVLVLRNQNLTAIPRSATFSAGVQHFPERRHQLVNIPLGQRVIEFGIGLCNV